MGGRGSKTKPTTSSTSPRSRRASFQTFVVVVDPQRECVDEMRSPGNVSIEDDNESSNVNATASTVQKILEPKTDLKKYQRTPSTATNVDLQFSSSEDSDDDAPKKKRKSAKKKTKKRKTSREQTAVTPTSSPVKLKLNELKVPKKNMALHHQPPQRTPSPIEYFEQIKDAYALTEYTSKDSTNDTPPTQPQSQETPAASSRQSSPSKAKPQPSPVASPGKFFTKPFDNWRKPSNDAIAQSNRLQKTDARDPSSRSPPKVTPLTTSTKNNSTQHDNHTKGDPGVRLDEGSFVVPTVRNQTSEIKTAEARQPVDAGWDDSFATQYRTGKRNLRIDDIDESIMDDILAEVIT